MTDPHRFAVDVLRIVCDRFRDKAADLRLMAETTSSFEEWLNWEAYLACKLQKKKHRFCNVTAKPRYGGEEVMDEKGKPCRKQGDLRVGATYRKDDHRWVFAEFALLHDGNRKGDKWQKKIAEDVVKLKRLAWVNSISMLVIVAVSRQDVLTTWDDTLKGFAVWNRPALTEPFALPLPGTGSLVVKAFDVKQRDEHVQADWGNPWASRTT